MRLIRNAARLILAIAAVAFWSFVAIPAVAHDLPRLAFAVIRANRPMTYAEIKVGFEDFPPGALGAVLAEAFKRKRVVRTGTYRNYSYTIAKDYRALIERDGIEKVVRQQRHSSSGRPSRRRVTADVEQEIADAAALQIAQAAGVTTPDPAGSIVMQRAADQFRPLSNGLRPRLPWDEEEEAPPCIGERYRDALRPRPLDD